VNARASVAKVSDTYSSVDQGPDVEGAINWQERIDQWPAIAVYKKRMDELAGGRSPALDIGAGPGLDAARVGAIGVDLSRAMAARAQARNVRVVVGDALALPVASATIASVRCDRVLQHLPDPLAALREMIRVCVGGARLVIADPDQQTLSIHVPGVPQRITRTLRRLRRDVGYRNGEFISTVPALLADFGLTGITVQAFPLVLTNAADAFGIATWVDRWRHEGGFGDRDDRLWRDRLAASSHDGFEYAVVTYFVVSAQTP